MWKFLKVLVLVKICCSGSLAEIFNARSDETCELKVNGSLSFLSVNRTWTSIDDPCTVYKCLGRSGSDAKIDIEKLKCSFNCSEGQIFKLVPGECCGKCFSTTCDFGARKFKPGDIWKSDGNCTINECIDEGFEPIISSYKKNCPKLKNCPQESIEMRDCCPYCNYRRQRNPQTVEVEFTNRDTYRSHPCLRECVRGQQLTCYYEFVVEEFETMSKACYNCPSNMTDCFRPHCVSTDGMKRSITVVNRMMPGPSIEVCINDTIIVDVKNHLMSEGTTIHWHGIHQRNTPYMDGVPQVSQCAIPAGQSFRYQFNAENAGTHFWHSHLGMQRGDGVFGPLIVRNSEEIHENLYDFDLPEHVMVTNDWTHLPSTSVFTAHHHGRGSNKPPNILINGRGKYFGNMTKAQENLGKLAESFQNIIHDESESVKVEIETTTDFPTTTSFDDEILLTTQRTIPIVQGSKGRRRLKRNLLDPDEDSSLVPYEVFNVIKGRRYRFRHINAGFLNCPIEISVDNHTIIAIASDGNNLEPVEVTFLTTYAGERWDFIINANQEIGNYFIRAKGLMDCDERFTKSFQMAVLHYQGALDENPPGIKPSYDNTREGLALNSLNRPQGYKDSITVAEMKSAEKRSNKIMKPEADFKFYLSYDFYGKDNPLFHKNNLYGFNQVPFGRIYTPQINHITMKMPSVPVMLAKSLQESTFCNESSLAAQGVNCKETFCECTHVLQIPLNSVVEMVLIDEGVTYDANHMFHLHGNYFRVVGMDRIGSNVTVEEVKELDKLGKIKRKFNNAPEKDTVTVPDGGYTIVRFYTDNPGFWLLHCHIDFHAEVGMAVILKIGDNSQMAPVPKGFPVCFDYTPNEQKLKSSTAGLSSSLNFITFLMAILIFLSK